MHRTGGPPRHGAGARRARAAGARHASARGQGFGRFVALTLMSLVPGAGLLLAGRRRSGGLLLAISAAVLVSAVALLLVGDATRRVLTFAVQPRTLALAAVVAGLVGVLWCLSILVTAWAARPAQSSGAQRALGVALVAALCVAVAAPSSVGVRYALIQRDLVTSLFTGAVPHSRPVKGAAVPVSGPDPWAGVPRVNLLLIGSDAGPDRTGVRTDSMIVASIDTKTGNTVLFGLPRNLEKVPFPVTDPLHSVWPNGFNCGDACLLNAVWQQAAEVHPDLFPGDPNPGLTATRDAVSEVLGLKIDSYAIIDLRGFTSLVDAMGGVDVNVPRRIPIGGGHNQFTNAQLPIYGYIEPGRRHLNGYQALWFARSRQGSDDYDRMARQRCMVTSLLDQANPAQLLSRYPELASVAKNNIQTDIRQQDLGAWVVLVERIQKGHIRSLPFTDKVISPADPNFAQIRALVTRAIAPAPTPTPRPSASAKPRPATDASVAQSASSVC